MAVFCNIIHKYKWPAGIIAVYFVLSNMITGYYCPSQAIIGLPCPACGMTRAFLLLLQGRFAESFNMHPLIYPVVLLIGAYAMALVFRPRYTKYFYYPVMILILVSFLLFFYRLVNSMGTEPMVLNPNALLRRVAHIKH